VRTRRAPFERQRPRRRFARHHRCLQTARRAWERSTDGTYGHGESCAPATAGIISGTVTTNAKRSSYPDSQKDFELNNDPYSANVMAAERRRSKSRVSGPSRHQHERPRHGGRRRASDADAAHPPRL
jgi:hypothetical protein